MFTGIIEEIGKIRNIEKSGTGIVLSIDCSHILEGTMIGDSIAIDGVCQTVTSIGKDYFSVFVSKISLGVTTLGGLKKNNNVNLERAMSLGGRFGGHMVQGHVDCTGKLIRVVQDDKGIEFEISVEDNIRKYLVEKGSVSVDGISLTIVSLTSSGFRIYIIPETIAKTTLVEKKAGDAVNIETDIIAKYIERIILSRDSSRDKDSDLKNKLMEEGFI